jgi:hypothetical protein
MVVSNALLHYCFIMIKKRPIFLVLALPTLLLFSGCHNRLIPDYDFELSNIVGTHVLEDFDVDANYGIYRKGDRKVPSLYLEIAYFTDESDVVTPLYTVENTENDECAFDVQGGCSTKITYEKTITFSLKKEFFSSRQGSFRIGLLTYRLDQPDEDKKYLSKGCCHVEGHYRYAIENGKIIISHN